MAPGKPPRPPGRRPAFRRARQAGQKDERRRQLLAAASRAFIETEYDTVTMAAVARAARLAKGTPFRYFATKETLFLELLFVELDAWLAELETELGRLRSTASARASLARRIAGSLVARPALIRLLGLLHLTLERNVAESTVLEFKLRLVARLAPAAEELARVLSVPSAIGVRLFVRLHALVVGLGQMSDPASRVRAAIAAEPRLAALEVDFAGELEALLALLLAEPARG